MENKNNRNDVYSGKATIVDVSYVEFTETKCREWKQWEQSAIIALPEKARSQAIKIVIRVKCGDGIERNIFMPYWEEELKGDALTWFAREDGTPATKTDETKHALKRQGLISSMTNTALDEFIVSDEAVGKEVTVSVWEELRNDKWWENIKFISPTKLITGSEKAARLAAIREGRPAPKPTANAAAHAPAAMPPAPESDPDDLPF